MIKRMLGIICLVGSLGMLPIKASINTPKIIVECVENKADLDCAQEQALFVNFYSTLYANKKVQEQLNIQDLSERLKKTFENEQQLFLAGKTVWIRALDTKKNVIGLLILSDLNDVIRIQRCAIECVHKDIAEALVTFIFEKYSQAKRLATVCLKESMQEIRLLKSFGFTQTSLIDPEYDATRYTSFVFDRPQRV